MPAPAGEAEQDVVIGELLLHAEGSVAAALVPAAAISRGPHRNRRTRSGTSRAQPTARIARLSATQSGLAGVCDRLVAKHTERLGTPDSPRSDGVELSRGQPPHQPDRHR